MIVRPDILRSRSRAHDVLEEAERLNEMLREAEKTPLSRGGISAEYAEEIIAEIRGAETDDRGAPWTPLTPTC